MESIFNKDRLSNNEIEFDIIKKYLNDELNIMDTGKTKFYTIDEADEKLDKILARYENLISNWLLLKIVEEPIWA